MSAVYWLREDSIIFSQPHKYRHVFLLFFLSLPFLFPSSLPHTHAPLSSSLSFSFLFLPLSLFSRSRALLFPFLFSFPLLFFSPTHGSSPSPLPSSSLRLSLTHTHACPNRRKTRWDREICGDWAVDEGALTGCCVVVVIPLRRGRYQSVASWVVGKNLLPLAFGFDVRMGFLLSLTFFYIIGNTEWVFSLGL
jgi:hypothetical protein